ncbi:hypothetical protein [Burkholderia cenocepacia]|uniref:hypothetical protein n=1 Tax=Burkholderia cenocepacia TaxID=95486 RepID=UPI002AB0833D|nr:hypothetical protein [Burkholderia cenocepacia]
MTLKHIAIAGFRMTRSTSKRGRRMSKHRPVRLSEARQLLDAFITRELHHCLARAMRRTALEHDAQAAATRVSPPRRATFNVGRIDPSKCRLPIISSAEAEAMARRDTLMHFGLDPES